MSDTIETIDLTPTSRLRIVTDTDAECPRGNWHTLTGFVKLGDEGDSRLGDVPPVHDDPIGIAAAYDRLDEGGWKFIPNVADRVDPRRAYKRTHSVDEYELTKRWARIFHGLHLEHDRGHGGFWFVALDGPELFADNWPDLVLGTPEHLAKQAEVIEQEREVYRQWADGEAVGVILEREVTWVREDDPSTTRDNWEDEQSVWGSYLDDKYTAQQFALDTFELDEDEVAALRPRPVVGQMAWSRAGLDPRPVAEVSEDGKQIRLDILGLITEWVPAYNYHFKEA